MDSIIKKWEDDGDVNQKLDLSGLELTYLPCVPANVRFLDVSRNNLEKLPHLPVELEELDCSFNIIKNINNIPPFLSELIVSNNKLSDISVISNMKKLKKVDASFNDLMFVPYINECGIKYLNLENNYITQLPDFSDCNLEKLFLSNNKLKEFNTYAPHLKILEISNNKLEYFPDSNFTELEYLLAGFNKLTKIPDNLDSIKVLELNNNNITDVSNVKFDKLKKLFIRDNKLSTIQKETLAKKLNDLGIETDIKTDKYTTIPDINLAQVEVPEAQVEVPEESLKKEISELQEGSLQEIIQDDIKFNKIDKKLRKMEDTIKDDEIECVNDKDLMFNPLDVKKGVLSVIVEKEKRYKRYCFTYLELIYRWNSDEQFYILNDNGEEPILIQPVFKLPYIEPDLWVDRESYKNALVFNSLFVKQTGHKKIGNIKGTPHKSVEQIFTLIPISRNTNVKNLKISEEELGNNLKPEISDINPSYFKTDNVKKIVINNTKYYLADVINDNVLNGNGILVDSRNGITIRVIGEWSNNNLVFKY